MAWIALLGALSAQADAEERSGTPPAKVHVQLYAADGLTEPDRRALETALADGVRTKLSAARVTSGYPGMPTAGTDQAADKALERSDKALAEAKERVKNLEDGALDLLDWAADEYSRYLPELLARDGNPRRLVEVYAQTAIAGFLAGDNDAAVKALRRALVLKPDLEYDPEMFPPQLEELVLQERFLFDELGRGKLDISVEGGDPTVYVNGIDRGKPPVTVDELPPGPNIVTLVAPGIEPVMLVGVVEGHETTTVTGKVEIPASSLGGPLAGTRDEVGPAAASKRLGEAARKLGVEALVLAVPTVKAGGTALAVHVYDMRSGTLVGRSEALVETGSLPEAEQLAEELIGTVQWRVVDLRVGGDERDPFYMDVYRHEYFWPAVGATAGVVALAIVIKLATGGLSTGEKVGLFPVLRF